MECPLVAKSGNENISIGILAAHSLDLSNTVAVTSGNTVTGESMGLSGNNVTLTGDQANINSGNSEQYSSVGINAGVEIRIKSKSLNVSSGDAPNAESIALISNGLLIVSTGQKATIRTGTASSTFALVSQGDMYLGSEYFQCQAGVATNGNRFAVATSGTCCLYPTDVNIYAGDAPKGAFYVDSVLWAVENGITTGTAPLTFSPTTTCIRGQIVTFLRRTADSPEVR